MKWYKILILIFLIGGVAGIVIYGMNYDKINNYIIISSLGLNMRICEENDGFIDFSPDLSPCVMIDDGNEDMNYDNQIKKIDGNCKCQERGGPCIQPLYKWENTTHYIDNNFCEFIEKPENCTGNFLSFINSRSNIFNENADSVIWKNTDDSIIEKPGFMECVNQLRNVYGK